MHRLCQANKKSRNQMVNLLVTEISTYNQITYCHRNSKNQVGSSQKSKAINVPLQTPVAN